MPIQAIERNGASVHITVSDTLRSGDLALIRDALQLGPRRDQVVVDFHGARDCPPAVLLELLDLFLSLAVSYELTGLSEHGRRLLGYLRPRDPGDGGGSPGGGRPTR